MIAIARIILVILLSIIVCIFGIVYCLFRPRDPRNVAVFSRYLGYMSHIFGIQLEVRYPKIVLPHKCVYISNHQSNYDMVTASYVVQPRTVTVGKKKLLWVPLFGLFYWLTGNLFIDRDSKISAHNTISKIVKNIKKFNMSVWIFPEGTRSRGRGLLPFKVGAFYTAIVAEVPIVPICISNIYNKIKLNRWSNGLVIIEILEPIETAIYSRRQAQLLAKYCRNIMKEKIENLNAEVTAREAPSRLN